MPGQDFDGLLAEIKRAQGMGQATEKDLAALQVQATALLGKEVGILNDMLVRVLDLAFGAVKVRQVE